MTMHWQWQPIVTEAFEQGLSDVLDSFKAMEHSAAVANAAFRNIGKALHQCASDIGASVRSNAPSIGDNGAVGKYPH